MQNRNVLGKYRETEEGDPELPPPTHPSTAGERSGLLPPLARYLLWLCRRRGRPGPQCSPGPSRPPMLPPSPAGTEPPMGPPPSPPRSLIPPNRPRASESGVSPSVKGRSINKRCHSCQGQTGGSRSKQRMGGGGGVNGGMGEKEGVEEKTEEKKQHLSKCMRSFGANASHLSPPPPPPPKAHTSAKCAAVSSIPLAPPSRRLRENAHRWTKKHR